MQLDDLKNEWTSADRNPDQKILTSKNIREITQKRYQSKLNSIKYPEIVGSVICILGLAFVGFNFNKLDTWFLQVIGVITLVLLMLMPALSFLSLVRFNSAENFDKPHVQVLKEFASEKMRFVKYQKLNALLSYVLLVTTIILLPKFFYSKDISISKSFWTFAFSIGYIVLIFFSKWVQKVYGKSLKQAELLLEEL